MTSCKEIRGVKQKKRNVFDVKISIQGFSDHRKEIVKKLRGVNWQFAIDLADLIEAG